MVELVKNTPLAGPNSIHFEGINEVEQWLSSLNEYLYVFQLIQKKLVLFPSHYNLTFDKLYEKNEKMINFKFPFGELEGNPTKLINNLFECNLKAYNVFMRTYLQLQLNSVDNQALSN